MTGHTLQAVGHQVVFQAAAAIFFYFRQRREDKTKVVVGTNAGRRIVLILTFLFGNEVILHEGVLLTNSSMPAHSLDSHKAHSVKDKRKQSTDYLVKFTCFKSFKCFMSVIQ